MAIETLKERIARKKAEQEVLQSKNEDQPASPIDTMVSELTAVVKQEEKKTEPTLDDLLDAPLGVTNKAIADEAAIVTADIIPRIRQLNSLSEASLETEMKLLKAALMANPEAVTLMLPEDIGEMVVALRKITKEAIITAESKVTKKATGKAKPLDLSVLADDF
jgi:hypothetical protein